MNTYRIRPFHLTLWKSSTLATLTSETAILSTNFTTGVITMESETAPILQNGVFVDEQGNEINTQEQ